MKKIVSYLRISSNSQIDNTSIESQREKIELYAKLNDFEIVEEFIDEGYSAKSIEREGYSKMINFIKEHEDIFGVVVYKADRIHRSQKNLLIMIDELQEHKVGFVSVTEQFDTTTAQGMLFLQMLGSFSEFERKVINERTKSGRLSLIAQNKSGGGLAPFGYMIDKNNNIVVNPVEAEIVKDIFWMRSKGKTMVEIGKKYDMTKQRIRYMLSNKTYIGKYQYNGAIEKNNLLIKIEPIVSTYLFNKINKKNK